MGRGRPKLNIDPRRAIVALRKRRVRVKEIAADLGLSERAVRTELAAFVREAPVRQSSAIPWRRTRPSALATLRGPVRLHFAERVIDLAELCRLMTLEGEVTVTALARVVGLEEDSALHSFYAMAKQLAAHGVVVEKEAKPGVVQANALITFDLGKAQALVKRELPGAEKLLTEWKEKHGTTERYRGRKA